MSISRAAASTRSQCLQRLALCRESVPRRSLSRCRPISSSANATQYTEASGDGHDSAQHHGRGEERYRGRYSGKPTLRPEHVISRLQQPSNVQLPQRPQRERRPRDATLPEHALRSMRSFMSAYEQKEEDSVLMDHLNQLRNSIDGDQTNIQLIGKRERFQEVLGQFTLRCCARWVQAVFEAPASTVDMIQPAEAIATYCELHNGPRHVLSDSIWIMSSHILEYQASKQAAGSSHKQALDTSLHALTVLWYMLLSNTRTKPDSNSLDWSFLPRPADLIQTISGVKPHARTYEAVFGRFASSVPERGLSHPLHPVISSLITNHLLQKPVLSADGSHATSLASNRFYAPLATLFEIIKQECTAPAVPLAIAEKLSEPTSPQAQKQYLAVLARYGIPLPEASAQDGRGPSHDPYATTKSITSVAWGTSDTLRSVFGTVDFPGLPVNDTIEADESTLSGMFIRRCLAQLRRAMRDRDPKIAIAVKEEVIRISEEKSEVKLTPQLYELLMFSLMLLKASAHVQPVWASFIKSGHEPTVRTFTYLMVGARHLRNLEALEKTWQSMIEHGIQPDATAWSTRIYALIRGGKVSEGMAALRSMSEEWINSQKSGKTTATPTPPAPNMIVINSALSALALTRKADHLVPKVLAWGRQLGLEPDTETYNVMLSVAARTGQDEESVKILEQMQERGMQASSSTWTVLVTDMFSKQWLNELSSDEIHDQVKTLLKNLDSLGGPGLDNKGYATLLNSLLKQYNHTAAAQTVLKHMNQRGMEASPHIYTILLTAYFDAQPQPDFDSLDKMWQHIRAQNRGYGARLDSYFWDRAVEGYARYHHTCGLRACFDRLQDMRRASHMPSWPTLGHVAAAAADRKDMGRLAQLVDDVRQWERENRIRNVWHQSTSFGRYDFWKRIVETGILHAEGITHVSQIPPVPVQNENESLLQEE